MELKEYGVLPKTFFVIFFPWALKRSSINSNFCPNFLFGTKYEDWLSSFWIMRTK
jgi:hypothetical protein